MSDELDKLTIKGAAEIASCDRSTILRAIQGERLKAILVPTPFNRDLWTIDRADLDEWMAKRSERDAKSKGGGATEK